MTVFRVVRNLLNHSSRLPWLCKGEIDYENGSLHYEGLSEKEKKT